MRVLNKLTAAMLAAGLAGAAHGAAKIPVDLALTQATLIDVAAGTRTRGQHRAPAGRYHRRRGQGCRAEALCAAGSWSSCPENT